jgi:osmotically-inducible protein OsmY
MFQKTRAETLLRHIPGVVGVLNKIDVLPHVGVRDLRKRIVQALHRSADVNARQVEVKIEDDVATLTGTVGSWLQREAAEHAAWSAPGITHVDNRITIVPTFLLEDVPEEND